MKHIKIRNVQKVKENPTGKKDEDFLMINFEYNKSQHIIKVKGKYIIENILKKEIKNYIKSFPPEEFSEWENKEIEV